MNNANKKLNLEGLIDFFGQPSNGTPGFQINEILQVLEDIKLDSLKDNQLLVNNASVQQTIQNPSEDYIKLENAEVESEPLRTEEVQISKSVIDLTGYSGESQDRNNYIEHNDIEEEPIKLMCQQIKTSQDAKSNENDCKSVKAEIKLDPLITEETNIKGESASEVICNYNGHSDNNHESTKLVKKQIKSASLVNQEIINDDEFILNDIADYTNIIKTKNKTACQIKTYKCLQCSYVTHNRSTFRNHKIKHNKKTYTCPQCPFKTRWKDYIRDHINIHGGDNKKHFLCKLCDFKSAFRSCLRKHLNTVHNTERKFPCTLCSYNAKERDGLTRHIRRTHNEGKCFQCDMCDYKSEFKRNLAGHKKTHTDESFVKCLECEYRCKTKKNLKIHMVTHTRIKQFECFECGYKAAMKSTLSKHILIHRSEKPHKCNNCEYSTIHKYMMNQHIKKYYHSAVVRNELLKCTICNYVAISNKVLSWHVKVHTDQKLYECNLCEYKTNCSSNLRKHEYLHENKKKS